MISLDTLDIFGEDKKMSKIIEKPEKSKNSITDTKKLVSRQIESSQKDTELVIEEVMGRLL